MEFGVSMGPRFIFLLLHFKNVLISINNVQLFQICYLDHTYQNQFEYQNSFFIHFGIFLDHYEIFSYQPVTLLFLHFIFSSDVKSEKLDYQLTCEVDNQCLLVIFRIEDFPIYHEAKFKLLIFQFKVFATTFCKYL